MTNALVHAPLLRGPSASTPTASAVAAAASKDGEPPASGATTPTLLEADDLVDDDEATSPGLSRVVLSAEDGERYRVLVDGQFDAVWRTLRGLGVTDADADDCAQKVFLIALRRIAGIAHGRERSFVLGTAVRVAANARRSRRRSREVIDPDALLGELDGGPDPEQLSALRERRAIVARILATMPDDLREVFVLFEFEGLTAADVGEAIGIPTGTASSRLRRAREHFRAEVAELEGGARHE